MAKYEELIDDFELEKRIRTIPEDMDLSEYIKKRGGVDYPEEEKADGGSVGIEILFEKKKDGGRIGFQSGGAQFTSGGNISPGTDKKGNVRNDNPFTGGGGDDGPKGPPSITNPYIGDVIEKAIIKKFEDKIPKPDNDPFKLLKGYSKTLPGQSNRFPPMFRTDATPYASKNLLDAALTELNLEYPNLNFTDQYGFYNTENIKTAVDNAVLKGDISPIEGLNITKSITTKGDPSAIGLSYDNNLLNFATSDIGEGDYKGGIGVNLSDYMDVPSTYVSGNFNVVDDKLSKRDLGIDLGDGTLKLDQTTYPGFDYQKNVVDLNKDFNLANNLDLNLKGNIENYKSDGSTFRTDQSLTPTLTYTGGIGDGTFKLSGSKEIVEGGSLPNVSFTGSFPIDQKTYIDADGPQTMDKGVISLKGSDLLSGDRSAVLGYDKTIGEIGDNFYLDAGGQIDLTNPDNYAAMLKLRGTFEDGGRVGLFMGGDPLTGQALAIYNSMKAYGEEDQAIADKLQSLGYYDPNASTPSPAVPRKQVPQGRGGEGIMELQKTFTTLPGDPDNFRLSQLEGTSDYFPPTTTLGKTKNLFMEKFFQPKVKGTLGDRLLKQSQGITSKIPLPGSTLAYMRSPFNPDSPTYNPLLPGQLNFLEAGTGTRVTGTSDNLKFTEGLSLIGRDPNSGLLKYGPGSVLSGKNVISGFGTNNYEAALNKYIQRMNRYEKPTKFQQEKIKQAQAELAAEKQRQITEAKTKAEALAAIKSQGKMDYNPNIHGPTNYGRDSKGNQSFDFGGGFGIGSDGGPVSNRTGRGRQGYGEGGLATMFVEKR